MSIIIPIALVAVVAIYLLFRIWVRENEQPTVEHRVLNRYITMAQDHYDGLQKRIRGARSVEELNRLQWEVTQFYCSHISFVDEQMVAQWAGMLDDLILARKVIVRVV